MSFDMAFGRFNGGSRMSPSVKSVAIAATRRRRRVARPAAMQESAVDRFRGQHLAVERQEIVTALGRADVTVDELESPLAWLARRRGRDGRALIEQHQLQAGERLRLDFTVADLMPRTTANWSSPLAPGANGVALDATDTMTDARRRVHKALAAVGPELAGLLLDVCCFLKGLEDVERERQWPPRSAKIVLQLALERLARHYGYAAEAKGHARAPMRTWLADDAVFRVD
jgi:hypothetical protein